jgi:hypothetical protein
VVVLEHDPDLHLESNRLDSLPASLVAKQDFERRKHIRRDQQGRADELGYERHLGEPGLCRRGVGEGCGAGCRPPLPLGQGEWHWSWPPELGMASRFLEASSSNWAWRRRRRARRSVLVLGGWRRERRRRNRVG